MARRPRPWWRRSHRMFFTTVHGKQHPLNVTDPTDEAGAWDALKSLINRLERRPETAPTMTAWTCREAVEAFLQSKAGSVKPITLRNYARHLAHFVDDFGPCQVNSLEHDSVRNRTKLYEWSDTNTSNYLATVEACLRSAGKIVTFDKPGRESAGAESLIPEAVYKACLRETTGDFHQFIRFLWATGCRPGEASQLTFDMIDASVGVARLKQHKTKGKTGRPRLLYLGPDALSVVMEQGAKYATGYLFRGLRRKPYSLQAVVMRFTRLSAKVGHRLAAYDFRHTFATRALKSGVPDTQVAALLGHANTTMLHRHYSHVTHDAKLLRGIAANVER